MIDCFKSIYRNKKVLVTGHTGFKGSWLCLWLKQLGADVIGYSLNPNTKPNLFQLLNLETEVTNIIGDIRDEENITKTIKKYEPEIIFHLAAQPLVKLSYEEPKLTYETNVIGTLNLFEAIRKSNNTKVIINVTTDKCYENKEWNYSYRENDALGGYDPYSSSKGCAELLTSCYRNSYFSSNKIAISSVRAGNVIGGGDWAKDRLIPDIVKSLNNKNDILIRNPNAIRPWQYVLEPLSGYLWLGALMFEDFEKYSQAWNFGPNDNVNLNVKNIVEKAINIFRGGVQNYILDENKNHHEANLLSLDITKAKNIINWFPVYNLENALIETINWYKEFYNNKNFNAKHYSINQIKKYVFKAKEKNLLWSKK